MTKLHEAVLVLLREAATAGLKGPLTLHVYPHDFHTLLRELKVYEALYRRIRLDTGAEEGRLTLRAEMDLHFVMKEEPLTYAQMKETFRLGLNTTCPDCGSPPGTYCPDWCE